MIKDSKFFVKRKVVLTILSIISAILLVIIIQGGSFNVKNAAASSPLSFPADHGQHPSFAAEWWYLNLLVKTTKGDGSDERDIGHLISFSRIAGNMGLLSSKYDNKSKSFKESTNTGGSLSVSLTNEQYLFIQYSNGLTIATLEETPPGSDRKRSYKLTGRTAEIGSFDLILKERTVVSSGYNTPLLWGGTTGNCRGKISVFGEDDTFYYSIPDLDITGNITDTGGEIRQVKTGKAWIDHQWFNNTPPSDWRGHYWTSLHLTHSSDLYNPGAHQAVGFVTQIYSNGPRYTYWVKRNSDGTNECGVGGKLSINNYGTTNYPASWKIELNKSNNLFLQMNGTTFSDNQIFKPPSSPQFFEPISFYSGNIDGKSFTGLGFFETHLNKNTAIPRNDSAITLRSSGTIANNIYPNVDVLVDDKLVKSFVVNGNLSDYNYTHPFAVNAEQIKVKFTNDYYKSPEDRNLRVDKLTINGKDYQTEAPSTYTFCGRCSSPGYRQNEWIYWNGYFHYLASFY